MFAFRLPALLIALMTFTGTATAADNLLQSVAYTEISGILIAQITVGDQLVFIHATSKNAPTKTLDNWKEGDTIFISSTSSESSPLQELTLINDERNQTIRANLTQEAYKRLPQIDSLTVEAVPYCIFRTKEKIKIGLSDGTFYEFHETDYPEQVKIARFWEKEDHIVVSNLEDKTGLRLLVNMDKPSFYTDRTKKHRHPKDLRKLIASEVCR